MGLDLAPDFALRGRPAAAGVLNVRGANIRAAAAHNRKIILQSLRVLKTAERNDLAGITGLTSPAVFKIVRDLLQEGLVISPDIRRGAKGQPAGVLAVNPDAAFSVGVGIAPDGLTMAVVDFAGVVRGHRRLEPVEAGLPGLRRALADGIDACLCGAFDPTRIAGAGVAAGPSPDARGDQAGMALVSLLGCPLSIEDEAVAAAHAEAVLGREPDPFFHLHIGARLGGALVADGHVVRGGRTPRGGPGAIPQLNPFRPSRTGLGKTLGDAVSLTAFRQHSAADEWVDGAADLLYVPLQAMFGCLDLGSVRIGGPLPPEVVESLCRGLNRRLGLEAAVRPAAVGALAPAVGAALFAFDEKWDLGR